jgi:hypothetical protein
MQILICIISPIKIVYIKYSFLDDSLKVFHTDDHFDRTFRGVSLLTYARHLLATRILYDFIRLMITMFIRN